MSKAMMILWQQNVRDYVVSDIVARLSHDKTGFGYLSYENVDELSGLYCFWVRDKCLYVGISTNLKRRLKQHCEGEDNKLLAEHFKAYGNEIKVSIVYEDTTEQNLRRLESDAIRELRPIANIRGIK